jgi:nucleoside-diphosphate-sugar epimerase
VASKFDKGVYTAPGRVDLVHEWAYLPDLAAAFVGLADNRDKLGAFESLNFADHAVTDLDMKAAAQCALGECLELASMPWWVLRLGSPFNSMWKAIVSMAYLRFEPHRLAPGRLAAIIGQVPHTSLENAVAGAITDLGADAKADSAIVPEEKRLAA